MRYKMRMSIQSVQTPTPPHIIDLGLGDPDPSLFPVDAIARAAQECFKQRDAFFLQYGTEQGDGYFRLALARFLSRHYGLPAEPGGIFVTAGVSSALALLCTCFTQAGDTIFIEEPTYFLAPKIFGDHRLNIVSIPIDENGLMIEALEEKLKYNRPKFLYTIPVHHNPAGTILAETRRAQLLELARQHDFLILADEVYQLLSYDDHPPRPFAAYIDLENIISLGSFSKILAPGLRLGWIQAHERVIQRLVTSGLLDSGGGMNPFTSAIVRGMIEAGDLDAHLQKLIGIYRQRLFKMDSLLKEHLPAVTYAAPRGGYFFWVRLPDSMNAVEFRRHAKPLNVDLRPGTLFSCEGGLQNFVRLCFAHYEEEKLEQGILRLRQSFENS
ncbi:MAG: PLP-dependent aminotransferase family protein [Bacteroidota bacterium]